MLNTLANHGFLPHDGKVITENRTINTLQTVLNIDPSLGEFLFQKALTTNPAPNATTFDLDNLDRHNILEHDASLRSVQIPICRFSRYNTFLSWVVPSPGASNKKSLPE